MIFSTYSASCSGESASMSRVAFNAKAKEGASDLLSGDFPSLTEQSVWLGALEIDRNWRSPNCVALSVPS